MGILPHRAWRPWVAMRNSSSTSSATSLIRRKKVDVCTSALARERNEGGSITRTYTRARRSDDYGTVRQLRSDAHKCGLMMVSKKGRNHQSPSTQCGAKRISTSKGVR